MPNSMPAGTRCAGWRMPRPPAPAFPRILQASNRPISVSRAWYWLGRAAEAGGPGNADEYYAKAANFPGTFYGQLAAARLGRKALNVTYPSPSADDRHGSRAARRFAPLPVSKRPDTAGAPTAFTGHSPKH